MSHSVCTVEHLTGLIDAAFDDQSTSGFIMYTRRVAPIKRSELGTQYSVLGPGQISNEVIHSYP